MSEPAVAISLPTLGRSERLVALAENVAEVTPAGAYDLVFICDRRDTRSQAAAQAAPAARGVLCDGGVAAKQNFGLRATRAPLVLCAQDDVIFHPGWLEAAVKAFSDPSVCVVGAEDLTPATRGGTHSTMPLLRRSYVDDPGAAFGELGTIFHEGYWHNFTETETIELAQHRGVWLFAPDVVIEHLHPAWGTREADGTDRTGNGRRFDRDRRLFDHRRAQWGSA